jgi:hypothetical protein
LRELNPQVPEWLDRIVRRLHAKDPARRFQSAEEVAEVLGKRLALVQTPGMSWRDPWWHSAVNVVNDWFRVAPWRRGALSAATVVMLSLVAAQVAGVVSLRGIFYGVTAANQSVNETTPKPAPASAADALAWEAIARETAELRDEVAAMEKSYTAPNAASPDAWQFEMEMLRRQLPGLEQELLEAEENRP